MKTLSSAEFFSLVWPSRLLTNEMLELRLIHRQDTSVLKRVFFADRSEIVQAAQEYSRDYNVYFGVSTRFGKASTKRDCYRVSCLWLDLDKHKMSDSNPPFDKLSFILDNKTQKPNIIVDSGGGLHAYWLLESPILVRDEQKRARVEEIARGICKRFKGDLMTVDVTRILRVPDCKNYKYS